MIPQKAPECVVLLVLAAGLTATFGQESAGRYAEEGQAALTAGRYAEAEKAFQKLQQLEPEMAEVHANLGQIYFEERKFEEAIPVLRHALKLKPTLSKSDNLLAMSLSEIGHYDEAAPGLDKCLRRSADSEIKRMCGLELERAYPGLHKDSKAVEVALELNRLYPDDPEILYQAGKVYRKFCVTNHGEARASCSEICLVTPSCCGGPRKPRSLPHAQGP